MVCKLFILATLVALTHAGVVAPLAARLEDTEYDPNPQYTFAYEVQDALTGDSKNQFETRNGDIVQGRYSLIEPDGSKRTVDYTADPINGFNAIVQREGLVVAAPAKVVAPLISSPVIAARTVSTPVVSPLVASPVVASPVVSAPILAARTFSAPYTAAPVLSARTIAAPLFARTVLSPARAAPEPLPATRTLTESVPETRRVAERVSAARTAEEPSAAARNIATQSVAPRILENQQNPARNQGPVSARSTLAKPQDAENVNIPAIARLAAPLIPGAPVARLTSPVPRLVRPVGPASLVASAPVDKLTYPAATLAYSAPLTAPYTKVVTPFGYSAAYTTII